MRRLLTRLWQGEGGFLQFLIPAISAAAGFFTRNKDTIGKIAGAAAPILGGMAGGRAQGQQIEGTQRLQQDEVRQRLFDLLSRNAGQQAQFGLQAPNVRFDQAMKGGLAANMQDVSAQVPAHYADRVVRFSGGLRPSAMGPQGRQAGQQLSQLALSQMGQDQIPSPAPPEMSGLPQSGFMDKLLGAGSAATSLLSLLPQGGTTPSINRPASAAGPTPFVPPSPDLLLPSYGIDELLAQRDDEASVDPWLGRERY